MWTHHDFFLQWQKVSKIVVKSKCYVNKIVEVYNIFIATDFFPLSIIYNLHWSGADGTKDTDSFYELLILSRVHGIKKTPIFLPPRCKKGLTHLQYLNLVLDCLRPLIRGSIVTHSSAMRRDFFHCAPTSAFMRASHFHCRHMLLPGVGDGASRGWMYIHENVFSSIISTIPSKRENERMKNIHVGSRGLLSKRN